MTLQEQAYEQASALAGALGEEQAALLRVLVFAAVSGLRARLREDVSEEDCREALVTAASLLALGGLEAAAGTGSVREFRAGDLTVKEGTSASASGVRRLESQAEALMGPYLRDSFCFTGV